MKDTFWTHDTVLFEGSFHYYRNKKLPVYGKIHVADERFDFHDFGHSLEREYLKNRKGTRIYHLLHPYVLQPNIVMNLVIQPKHYADAGDVLGRTTDARVAGVRHEDIGSAQAWYYQQDNVLVLWECFLSDFARDVPLLNDTNMTRLWTGFEEWLLNRYPDTEQIITPHTDPIWNTKEYQSFLRARGYKKGHPGTFAKLLK